MVRIALVIGACLVVLTGCSTAPPFGDLDSPLPAESAGTPPAAAAVAGDAPATPGLLGGGPITLTFRNTVTLDEAISTLARVSGAVIEISQTVAEDLRKEPLSPDSPILMRNVTVEQAIETLARLKGLSSSVVGSCPSRKSCSPCSEPFDP